MFTLIEIPAPVATWQGRVARIHATAERIRIDLGSSEIFSGTLDELARILEVAAAARKLQLALEDE